MQLMLSSLVEWILKWQQNLPPSLHCLNNYITETEYHIHQNEVESTDGTLVWKIDQYHKRKIEAQMQKNAFITSGPFYTSRYGYKMCARYVKYLLHFKIFLITIL